MSARSLYRLFLIGGLIVLAGIFGGFLGAYLIFKAIDTYGIWFYVGVGVAFAVIVVVFYVYDLYREKKPKVPHPFETMKQPEDSETETHEENSGSSG
jgi:NADH:ubiquinone oxidoreductase subunit 2 (subunit N)